MNRLQVSLPTLSKPQFVHHNPVSTSVQQWSYSLLVAAVHLTGSRVIIDSNIDIHPQLKQSKQPKTTVQSNGNFCMNSATTSF